MRSPIRTQTDKKGDFYSAGTSLDLSGETDLARQEFRDEADVNRILDRYGVNVPIQAQPQFGETDWDLDLHTAFISRDRAQVAFYHLSSELQAKYGTPARMLDAMNSGELEQDLRAEQAPKTVSEPETEPPLALTPDPKP